MAGEEKVNIEEILKSVEPYDSLLSQLPKRNTNDEIKKNVDVFLDLYRNKLREALEEKLPSTAKAKINKYVESRIERLLAENPVQPVDIIQSQQVALGARLLRRTRNNVGHTPEADQIMRDLQRVGRKLDRILGRQELQKVRNMPRLKWLFLGVRADPEHPFHNIYKLLRNLLAKAMAPFKRFIGPIFTKLGYPYPTATSLFEIIWDWGEMNFYAILDLIWRPANAGFKFANIFAGFVPGVSGKESLKERVTQFIIQLLQFAAAAVVIGIQFYALQWLFGLFDSLSYYRGQKTNFSAQADLLMHEYCRFLQAIFDDSSALMFRMFKYQFTGGGPITPNTWTAGLKSDKRLFFIAKQVIKFLNNVLAGCFSFFGPENKKPIQGWWDDITWTFRMLIQQGREWKASYDQAVKLATEIVLTTAKDVQASLRIVKGALGDILLNPRILLKRLYIKMFPNDRIGWIPTSGGTIDRSMGLQPHNVMTVCSILGISKSTFDSLENKKMVKYVNENPLHTGQVFCAVVHADRELRQRKVKSCTTLSLRF